MEDLLEVLQSNKEVGMEFTVKTTLDMSGLKAMTKSVKAVNKRHIRYGWIDGKSYPASHKNAGIPIATVANWQEFGLSGSSDRPPIPSRPYFRQAINMSKKRYRTNLASIFGTAIKGGDTASRLTVLANELVIDYSESVLRQNYKSLSPYTVKLKGHSYQMDDSGVMFANFKSKVYRTSIDNIKG